MTKYSGRLIWFAIITFLLFFFVPAQEKHYLRYDLEKFKRIALLTKVGLGCLLVLILIVVNHREIKNFKEGLTGSLLLTIFIAWALFIFGQIINAGFLFANRIIPINKTNREFVVSTIAADSTDTLVDFVEDGRIKDIIWDGPIIEQIKSMHLKPGQKFRIPFARGIFGVYFLNGKPKPN